MLPSTTGTLSCRMVGCHGYVCKDFPTYRMYSSIGSLCRADFQDFSEIEPASEGPWGNSGAQGNELYLS